MADTPFTPINSINNKTPVKALELYNAYLTNKFFSYFKDTILIANIGNQFQVMDKEIHFTFYNSIVSKGRRFSKWSKSAPDEELSAIATYYDISISKAKDIMKILTEEQKEEIFTFMKEKYNG